MAILQASSLTLLSLGGEEISNPGINYYCEA